MDTKAAILSIADDLLRNRGYHAFSFADVSKQLGIKTASIHYHFPTKAHLGVAIVQMHRQNLAELQRKVAHEDAVRQLESFMGIYAAQPAEKLCVVGALMSDINSVEPSVKEELKALTHDIQAWLEVVLEKGLQSGQLKFAILTRDQALLIATAALASLQWCRMGGKTEAQRIRQAILAPIINQP